MAVNSIPYHTLRFASYNMHGFNNGQSMLRHLCEQCDFILVQEHWLQTSDLQKLGLINKDFAYLAVSAMDDAVSRGILCGRPFGGTGILWRKNNGVTVKLLNKDTNGRSITVSISDKIVVTCVYFPCQSSSIEYTVEMSNICARLEGVIDEHPNCVHLIAGDFNFECNMSNAGYKIFNSVAADCGLKCMNNFDDKCGYTYFHESLGHKSWIDHVFVTSSVADKLADFMILDSGCNNSDHHPITWSLQYNACGVNPVTSSHTQRRSYKQRWDKADLMLYYSITGDLLQSIDLPKHLLHGAGNYQVDIEKYYGDIVDVLVQASKASVPNIPYRALKNFWNDELDCLKQQSIDIHELWKTIGKPRHGSINNARVRIKSEYKLAIRKADTDFEKSHTDEVTEYFAHKDMDNFWKSWNAKYSKHINTANISISGYQKAPDIANAFRDHYANTFINSADEKTKVRQFNEMRMCYTGDSDTDTFVSIEDIEIAVRNLRKGKAAGVDCIVAEHIINSHPCLIVHLKLLFNMMLLHGYVPSSFGTGIIVPLIKDKSGDLSSVENYRPITLSPVISKIFESVLLIKYDTFLDVNDRQFGFRKQLGCNNAIFVLRNVIEYFNERGSNVYLASLDASKAFDRVNHFQLYQTLMARHVPIAFLNIIVDWYSKLTITVRWNAALSSSLRVRSGVRQGGVLSPNLFNVYADMFINNAVINNSGCHFNRCCVACIMYADDLMLLSASVSGLQKLLDVCALTGKELCLQFNDKKSHCIVVGPRYQCRLAPMFLLGKPLQWVGSVKYLGITFMSAKVFSLDVNQVRRKFFGCTNSILANSSGMSELVKLHLMENYCYPVLSYALECFNLPRGIVHQLNVYWNSVYRKIFAFKPWESVRELTCLLERMNFEFLHYQKKLCFLRNMLFLKNSIIVSVMGFFTHSNEYAKLCEFACVSPHDSKCRIKSSFMSKFVASVA
jgi:hypothetical protein